MEVAAQASNKSLMQSGINDNRLELRQVSPKVDMDYKYQKANSKISNLPVLP